MHFRSGGNGVRSSAFARDSRSPTESISRLSQKPIAWRYRLVAEESDRVAHSPRRYLHIEVLFVFDGRLDHWSDASG
jgi:hypothetical protein